jgi:hypothetical protein
MEGRYLICGSPQTVLERLSETIEATMCGNMLFGFQIGSLPVDMARRSMERFATHVLPAIRKQFGDKLAARSDDVARPTRAVRQEVA